MFNQDMFTCPTLQILPLSIAPMSMQLSHMTSVYRQDMYYYECNTTNTSTANTIEVTGPMQGVDVTYTC